LIVTTVGRATSVTIVRARAAMLIGSTAILVCPGSLVKDAPSIDTDGELSADADQTRSSTTGCRTSESVLGERRLGRRWY